VGAKPLDIFRGSCSFHAREQAFFRAGPAPFANLEAALVRREPPVVRGWWGSAAAMALLAMAGCAAPDVASGRACPTVGFGQPLQPELFTADPAAHVFDGRIIVYLSHDRLSDIVPVRSGDRYDMVDYRAFSQVAPGCVPEDLGVILALEDVPWAKRRMWAPDAAYRNGTYYLFFPVEDREGIFRIGVATAPSPGGPFAARAEPIAGSYSIDPAVFIDDDGQAWLYFGGIWGGELERWRTGRYDPAGAEPAAGEPAIGPRVARLADDLSEFAGPVEEISILDEAGRPLLASDTARRFFEAPWMHKVGGRYYLSYSTGNTHTIVYAVGDQPTGPFVFRGRILDPVAGWTTHHSIVEFDGRWYLYYHDASVSGIDQLRTVRVKELAIDPDGTIRTLTP
jgi:hypothetical protein